MLKFWQGGCQILQSINEHYINQIATGERLTSVQLWGENHQCVCLMHAGQSAADLIAGAHHPWGRIIGDPTDVATVIFWPWVQLYI